MDFNNLVNNLDSILKASGNLYGFSGLTIIVIALLCFFFYIRSSGKDRNRAFFFTILCFMGLTLATLTTGILGGFQQGNEAGIEQGVEEAQVQIQQDPAVVQLSSNAARMLDTLITTDGDEVDPRSKTLMVEKAIGMLSSSLEDKLIEKPSWIQEKEGFTFNFQGCSRRAGSTNVFCNFLITNKEDQDRFLTMYISVNDVRSIIVDSQGKEYTARDASIGNAPTNSGWDVTNKLSSGIEMDAWIEFRKISEEVDQLQLAKFEFSTGQSNKFDVRHQDVLISN